MTRDSRIAAAAVASLILFGACTAVKVKCPNCGSLEEEDAKFCHKCGRPM